ncbi:MAG: YeeE/YedE family protein [Mesorhizobium sp.]
MRYLVNLLIGLLFGLGLIVSGMINPAKVLNFLDIAGTWDPSLAFVMAGAVGVAFVGFRLVTRRAKPIAADRFHVLPQGRVDARLVTGAAIFGVGWGLAGYCPGPAITALGLDANATKVFLVTMCLGFWAARVLTSGPRRAAPVGSQ